MGRMYSAVMDNISVTTANTPQDLFELLALTNVSVLVHAVYVSQTTLTVSELLQIKIHRGTATGSGGGTITPRPLETGMPGADTLVERNNTTQSVETSLIIAEDWNVVNPFIWLPPPKERIWVPGAGLFIVELTEDASATMNVSGRVIFEEFG